MMARSPKWTEGNSTEKEGKRGGRRAEGRNKEVMYQ
jgi:hypothetical protein